jgi:carboxylesterase type B
MFNNLALMRRPWDKTDRRLAALLSDYWANFIKHGNPNGPGLPAWPDDNGTVMRFGDKSRAEPILPDDKQAFFAKAFAR